MGGDRTLIKNVDEMYKKGLCTQCGTCYGVCPKNNIGIRRSPTRDYTFYVKDSNKCVRCGICYEVCPGHSVDFDRLNADIFSNTQKDNHLGNYRANYLAQSPSEHVRKACASGGVVSSLLTFAIETSLIQGALVVKMSEKEPLEPEVFVARNGDEVLSAAQSKYLPVPMNMGLREILHASGKYAVVGLPCHIHGLRKAEAVFPKLRGKIAFHIGLFCGPGPSYLMTDYLIKRAGFRISDVAELNYRDKRRDEKWPGGMLITTKTGDEKYIPLKNYLYAQTLFTRPRCGMCPDFANEFADISLGDAHLPEFWRGEDVVCSEGLILRGEDGWSMVISRTQYGEALLKEAVESKILKLIEIGSDTVTRSQRSGLYYKKRSFFARMKIRRTLGCELPTFNGLNQKDKLGIVDYVKPFVFALIQYFTNTKISSSIIRMIPQRILMKKFRFKQKLIDQYLAGGKTTE